MEMVCQQSGTGQAIAIFRGNTFDHPTQFVEHSRSNLHPAMIVHQNQVQVVPVLAMSTTDWLAQINTVIRFCLLSPKYGVLLGF